MKTDKELIRNKQYQEALGDNYCYKPIYVMIFEDGLCIDQLNERFESKIEAIKWLNDNKQPLTEGKEYYFGNINHDWL
jgi:hypothetical protein